MDAEIKLIIKGEYSQELEKFFALRHREKKELRDKLDKELEEIESYLKQLRGIQKSGVKTNYVQQSLNIDGYENKAPWHDKAAFVLKQKGEYMTTTEIVDELLRIDPLLAGRRKQAMSSISGVLGIKSNERSIFRRASSGKDGPITYGLIEWEK